MEAVHDGTLHPAPGEGDSLSVASLSDSLRTLSGDPEVWTVATLKAAMENVTREGREAVVNRQVMADFEERYFNGPWKYGLFRRLVIYVDKDPSEEFNRLDLVESTAEFYGAKVVSEMCLGCVTHVIVHSQELDRLDELKAVRSLALEDEKFPIVNENWIDDCVRNVALLNVEPYEM